jgi:SAM-dependent methyltransferase
MGFQAWYDRHIVPRFIRCACGSPALMELRGELIPLAEGHVFELGCGGGLNQRFYDTGRVTAFSGIDPTEKLLDYAREEAARKGWQADIREGLGEDLPFEDASFDTVVTTFTLCSVQDHARTMGELRRVLKPGGRLLYLEHGRAPDAGVAKWQDRIEPLWKRMAGGCHLTRPVSDALTGAGFAVEPRGKFYVPKVPKFAGWMEWGTAAAR